MISVVGYRLMLAIVAVAIGACSLVPLVKPAAEPADAPEPAELPNPTGPKETRTYGSFEGDREPDLREGGSLILMCSQ